MQSFLSAPFTKLVNVFLLVDRQTDEQDFPVELYKVGFIL